MKITLILALSLVFFASSFASAYEAMPGVPKDNQ